jgi:Big-like domain-containing protein
MKASLGKGKVALLCAFGILVFTLWNNVAVYAQNTSTAGNSTTTTTSQQHVPKIKITSPTRGQQLPVGKDLTVSGTSIDNATSNCQVAVIVNNVKPYQNATAAGTGGAADYSKWNFALTSKYTTIKQGDNRITARYECVNDPPSKGFSSVNVTGANQ